MKLKWTGVEFGNDKYFYWFDWISEPQNRLIGYEALRIDGKWNHMICFWWFCVCWSF